MTCHQNRENDPVHKRQTNKRSKPLPKPLPMFGGSFRLASWILNCEQKIKTRTSHGLTPLPLNRNIHIFSPPILKGEVVRSMWGSARYVCKILKLSRLCWIHATVLPRFINIVGVNAPHRSNPCRSSVIVQAETFRMTKITKSLIHFE
jgi:hypothetical protein